MKICAYVSNILKSDMFIPTSFSILLKFDPTVSTRLVGIGQPSQSP